MTDTPIPTATPAQQTLTDKLSDWFALKGQVKALQDRESELRREIFDLAFPNAPEKGTVRVDIGFGKQLKAVAKLNYTVDREAMAAALQSGLDPDVHERVIRYKPEVSESELFKVADPKTKQLLSSFITSKPGMPSMEIVDAKKGG